MRGLLTVCLSVLALGAGAQAAPRIELQPAQALEGDPVSIRVTGARPGEMLTLHARSEVKGASGQMRGFYGWASFKADGRGTVDLASSAPVAGTYQGADLRGLFWSERLIDKDAGAQAKAAALGLAAPGGEDRFALSLEADGQVVEAATLTLRPALPDVERREVRQGGLIGAFYFRKGMKHAPVVVILHGSEGGFDYGDWLGPRLASRGYAAFAPVYYAPPPRPVEGAPKTVNLVPVEILEQARAWLAAQPEADVERFGVVGASMGGELALLEAATYPWLDVVVAFVPSDLVTQGFSWGDGEVGMSSAFSIGGKPLAYLPQTGQREEVANYRVPGGKVFMARVRKANLARATPQELEAARIKLENSHAELLLLGGMDDQTGDSGASVLRAKQRMAREPYAHGFEAVAYPEAGHLIVDTGWRPTTTHNAGPSQDGGTPEADARAQADGWSRMLEVLKRRLSP